MRREFNNLKTNFSINNSCQNLAKYNESERLNILIIIFLISQNMLAAAILIISQYKLLYFCRKTSLLPFFRFTPEKMVNSELCR